MRGARRWGVLAAGVAVVVAVVGSTGGTASVKQGGPIVIGWAFDSKGQMAPFDGPALAAAKIRVRQINAKGGVDGRRLRINTCDTQNNNPARAKSCARSLLGGGARRHVHDLRRRLRDAGRPGGDQPRRARDRAVHRHRPDGAEALRQDEGQARVQLRQRRAGRGLGDGRVRLPARLADRRARDEHAARLLQERRQAFEKRFTQLGGRIVARENYATGANNVQAAVSRLNSRARGRDRHLDRVRRAAGARLGAPLAREPDADPQLVGRRRDVLGDRRTRR